MDIDFSEAADINVEVQALNLEGIKQNLLDYVQDQAKIDIADSVDKADKSAQSAETYAGEAAISATTASECAEQTSENLGLYYKKSETDALLDAKAAKATSLSGYGITDAYTKTQVDSSLSGKASTSLDNLSSAGQMIVDSQNGTISNCVLEIPQNIKCSIASNVVTLSSGSVLTNTGATYATTTLSANQTYTIDNSLADGNYLLCSNGAAIQAPLALSVTGSGASLPADGSTYTYFFNTTDKLIYKYADGAWSATSYCYPFALVTMSSGVASFAKDSNGSDMIFNGACFIGDYAVVYPGIKGLIAEGYNADGTLKSTLTQTTSLQIIQVANLLGVVSVRTNGTIRKDSGVLIEWREKENRWVVISNGNIYENLVFCFVTTSGYTVTDFTIRKPVRTATVEMVNKALGDVETLLASI